MKEENSLHDSMIDRKWVLKRKRKQTKSGLGALNGKEGASNSAVKRKTKSGIDASRSAKKTKGHDGHYYECAVCDLGGNLLCCDSCPQTYHLECLSPPLKCAPHGKWNCPNCTEKKGNVKVSSNIESNVKRARTKTTTGKPATVIKESVREKASVSGRHSIPRNNKGKTMFSCRDPDKADSDFLKDDKLDRPGSSHSGSLHEIPSDDRTLKNSFSTSHLKTSSRRRTLSLVKTSTSDDSECPTGKKPKFHNSDVQRKNSVTTITDSTHKSKKKKQKFRSCSEKKRPSAEKGSADAAINNELPLGRNLETNKPIQKRRSSDTWNSSSRHEAKRVKYESEEKDEMSSEQASLFSQDLDEQCTQLHNIEKQNVNSWNDIQQVDRIWGCRIRVSTIMSSKSLESEHAESHNYSGNQTIIQPLHGLNNSKTNGLLLTESQNESKVEIQDEKSACNGAFDPQVTLVSEEKDLCRVTQEDYDEKSYENKGSLDNVISAKKGSMDEIVAKNDALTQEDTPLSKADNAQIDIKAIDIVGTQNQSESVALSGPHRMIVSGDSKGKHGMLLEMQSDAKILNNTMEEVQNVGTINDDSDSYEFLVKWVGKSNIHNSWVPESQIKVIAKRKLENYKAKYGNTVINICEEQWKKPQRVIALQACVDGLEEALVKWCGLQYDECTWERLDEPVMKESAHLVDELKQLETQTIDKDVNHDFYCAKSEIQDFLPLLDQPNELKGGLLFPHQLEALNWLRKCWYKSKNVILADEMGLGKTISACAFISSLHCEFKVKLPCLVLVPLSTMPNWSAEFSLWAPHLNVVEYHGCAKARTVIRQYEWHVSDPSKSDKLTKSYKFDVLLTTYEMVLADTSHLRGVPWEVLIVDEGHRLKNSSSKLFGLLNTFSFQHRVLLTGTPLQNNIGEMYNLLNFLQPVSFPSLSAFEENFNDLTTAEKVDELKKLVAPHMLRRLKKDAMQNIPPKTERMVPVELTSIQAEYYRAMLTKNYQILRNVGKGGAQQSLLNIVMQLRKVCNHPYLIPGTEPESGSMEFLHEMRIKASAKLTLLHSMLKILYKEGHRVLIFSQMTKLLDILEDYLAIEFGAKTFERVDGTLSVANRQAAITRFNQDKSRFVFLLSTRSCGLGINLATADTVIIYDSDFNPHADIQAMNRAHRIGQSNRLLVYRLVVRGSVEERILQLAKRKLMLDQLFVNKSGSQKEVEDILRWGTEELFNNSDCVNGPDATDATISKPDAVPDGEHKHRRRSGGLGDVYKDKCTEGSTKIIWDENAILKLLDRSDIQLVSESADVDVENDMLGSVKSVDWNDDINEEADGMEMLPGVTGEDGEHKSEAKEDNAVGSAEENEWDKLLRVRWEKSQLEEEAVLGRGKRQRKAVSYRETFASMPSETFSESDTEEPERVYTPAGRAWKEKYARLRDRQKERIARRQNGEVSCLIDRVEWPTQSLIQSDHDMEGLDKRSYDDKIEQMEDNKSFQPLDDKRSESSAKFAKSIRHKYKKFHSDDLDLSVRPPSENLSSDIFLPSHPFNSLNTASPVPSNHLLPVLGLCAPNANQIGVSSRNNRGSLRQPISSSEQKRLSIGNTEFPFPPSSGSRSPNARNDEVREKSDISLLPEAPGMSLHHKLKSLIPDGYFPFYPVVPTSERSLMDGLGSASFASFQEKLGLPNLMIDDKLVPRFPLPSKSWMKPPADLLPSLSLGMQSIEGSFQEFPSMPPLPNFKQRPTDILKKKQKMFDLPSMNGLGSVQGMHPSFLENQHILLDNAMMQTQSVKKLFKKRAKADVWSEDELDALWIGVRRHGRGNWDIMLEDPKLKFAEYRTAEDLSLRWSEEQQKIMDAPAFSAPKSSKPLPLPGISDDMMNRALLGSKFSSIGGERPKSLPHLTDIQLGCRDLKSSFPGIDQLDHISRIDENLSKISPWQLSYLRSNYAGSSTGGLDGLERSGLPFNPRFQDNYTAKLGMNVPSSSALYNREVEYRSKSLFLPGAMDNSLNPLHGFNSAANYSESNVGMPLETQKQILHDFSSKNDIGVGSSNANKLPHWLREAVNPAPSRVPEPELPSVLPPSITAIAYSVRLLYGEDKTIPPFSIPGPPPIQPKDPRRILKRRRKLLRLSRLTPNIKCTTKNFDCGGPSTIPTASEILESEPVRGRSGHDENQNLNLNSPSSSLVDTQREGSSSVLVLSLEAPHMATSSTISRHSELPLTEIPGPSQQSEELSKPPVLEVDCEGPMEEDSKENNGKTTEKVPSSEQVDQVDRGGSSKTHSCASGSNQLKPMELSSEETELNDHQSENE
ncbi:protein CHROMATIN REMODELING 4-like isoform X3 [Zingiber officinale]|uniref:Protein CHROMATIN REMODELING 4 n=1 Tax=Zingiber officinale TaxID=94328 RepID=A0A8J5HKF4_ZINOF|nr:protein CHROMATIN REMODELING 4-like isoform X3 [Zingiber officinale]KAG6526841.1 hypothetical protein ZIOFF_016844 [Zingiber officinale]